jgi:hypothetical protein
VLQDFRGIQEQPVFKEKLVQRAKQVVQDLKEI